MVLVGEHRAPENTFGAETLAAGPAGTLAARLARSPPTRSATGLVFAVCDLRPRGANCRQVLRHSRSARHKRRLRV